MRRLLLAVVVLVLHALYRRSRSQTTTGRVLADDITIAEGETAGDMACVFCSVHVHGEVKGDVAVMFGKVEWMRGGGLAETWRRWAADLNLGPGRRSGAMSRLPRAMRSWRDGAMVMGRSGASEQDMAAAAVCAAVDSDRVDLVDCVAGAAKPVSVSGISAWARLLGRLLARWRDRVSCTGTWRVWAAYHSAGQRFHWGKCYGQRRVHVRGFSVDADGWCF